MERIKQRKAGEEEIEKKRGIILGNWCVTCIITMFSVLIYNSYAWSQHKLLKCTSQIPNMNIPHVHT